MTKTTKSSNYNRIAVNTVMLYFRMLLIMLVSLYIVRILLAALGQEDYGLYNVIGGIVVMFSFLTHVLSSASQRFFAYDIGQGNYNQLSKTYSTIILLFVLVIAVIILLAETIGLWFLHNKMTIPPERMTAANWVYQFSILSFCWKVFTSPYQAIIIAHEKMNIYAYVGVAEVFLQLILVLVLQNVEQDKLIVYSLLMFLIVFVINSLYIAYAKLKYRRIHFVTNLDKSLFKKVVSYSGWTLFGAFASLARSQGINVILNVYFTPVVNAARGIAHNVNGSVSSFAGNFYTAVKPQIVKYYAQEDLESCYKLVFRSTKMSFILIYTLILPAMLYTPEILTLWLKEYPDNTVIFTRLILVVAMISSLANPLITFNQATGNIKVFQIIISIIFLSNLPLSIIAFEYGAKPVYAFVISICVSIVAFTARMIILRIQHHFPAFRYIKKVLLPIVFSIVVTSSIVLLYYHLWGNTSSILLLFLNIILTLLFTLFFTFYMCFDSNEKILIYQTIKKYIK